MNNGRTIFSDAADQSVLARLKADLAAAEAATCAKIRDREHAASRRRNFVAESMAALLIQATVRRRRIFVRQTMAAVVIQSAVRVHAAHIETMMSRHAAKVIHRQKEQSIRRIQRFQRLRRVRVKSLHCRAAVALQRKWRTYRARIILACLRDLARDVFECVTVQILHEAAVVLQSRWRASFALKAVIDKQGVTNAAASKLLVDGLKEREKASGDTSVIELQKWRQAEEFRHLSKQRALEVKMKRSKYQHMRRSSLAESYLGISKRHTLCSSIQDVAPTIGMNGISSSPRNRRNPHDICTLRTSAFDNRSTSANSEKCMMRQGSTKLEKSSNKSIVSRTRGRSVGAETNSIIRFCGEMIQNKKRNGSAGCPTIRFTRDSFCASTNLDMVRTGHKFAISGILHNIFRGGEGEVNEKCYHRLRFRNEISAHAGPFPACSLAPPAAMLFFFGATTSEAVGILRILRFVLIAKQRRAANIEGASNDDVNTKTSAFCNRNITRNINGNVDTTTLNENKRSDEDREALRDQLKKAEEKRRDYLYFVLNTSTRKNKNPTTLTSKISKKNVSLSHKNRSQNYTDNMGAPIPSISLRMGYALIGTLYRSQFNMKRASHLICRMVRRSNRAFSGASYATRHLTEMSCSSCRENCGCKSVRHKDLQISAALSTTTRHGQGILTEKKLLSIVTHATASPTQFTTKSQLSCLLHLNMDVEGLHGGLECLRTLTPRLLSLSLNVNIIEDLFQAGLIGSTQSTASELPLQMLSLCDNRLRKIQGLGKAFSGRLNSSCASSYINPTNRASLGGLQKLRLDVNQLNCLDADELNFLEDSLKHLTG